MKTIKASDILFRSSANGLIMTDSKVKSEPLGATCISRLKLLYREHMYNRHEEFSTKHTEKGLLVEEKALTLYSRVKKQFYTKNEENIKNAFISGTPDTYKGESILKATKGCDIKSSWDLSTFPFPTDKTDKTYYWQNMSYMALTGATSWVTAYCLMNTPAGMIDDEKRRWQYKLGVIDTETDPSYLDKCKDIERNMIFDLGEFKEDYPYYPLVTDEAEWDYDIPLEDRVIEFTVERNEEEIAALYTKIELCRDYMRKNFKRVI